MIGMMTERVLRPFAVSPRLFINAKKPIDADLPHQTLIRPMTTQYCDHQQGHNRIRVSTTVQLTVPGYKRGLTKRLLAPSSSATTDITIGRPGIKVC
jgi:hypothetical protein